MTRFDELLEAYQDAKVDAKMSENALRRAWENAGIRAMRTDKIVGGYSPADKLGDKLAIISLQTERHERNLNRCRVARSELQSFIDSASLSGIERRAVRLRFIAGKKGAELIDAVCPCNGSVTFGARKVKVYRSLKSGLQKLRYYGDDNNVA